MFLYDTERIIRDEDVITEYFETSQVVCSCSGILVSAVFAGRFRIARHITLYDGKDTSGKLLLDLKSGRKMQSVPFIFQHPIRFNKGLYLYIGGVDHCSVQFVPDY